jgi:hypothetical protein
MMALNGVKLGEAIGDYRLPVTFTLIDQSLCKLRKEAAFAASSIHSFMAGYVDQYG